ncbi:acetate kinase, partial [Desulfovibrio sp. OttesenSCG-928-I05]|nr:acetate kinase [Desulfovibrio sp. OttesenSCG-928-I05]
HMGIAIDTAVNATRSGKPRSISKEGSAVPVLVIPTNEELEIAQATLKVLGK